MDWNLIIHGPNSGKYNMEFDLNLIEQCNNKSAFFRLYQWNPYCISLGTNQNVDGLDSSQATNDGIDIVKRPTGGRAILHAEELTYSVAMPIMDSITARDIYYKISVALVKGLGFFHPKLIDAELETEQPNFPALLKQPSGALCFASTAKSEVKFLGKKIIGSAQRKIGNTILQHGSILCGTFHRELPSYLNVKASEKEILRNELLSSTIEIEEITGQETDYLLLKQKLIQGFEEEWEITFANQNIH